MSTDARAPGRPGQPQWDVLGIGCTAVDDLFYLDGFPEPDEKMPVLRSERQCGGLTATALVAASRLGARCAYAGQLGSGPRSTFVRETFQTEGIDLSSVVHREEAEPVHAVVLVDVTRQTRSILIEISGPVGAHDTLPAPEVIQSTRVLLVDHYGLIGARRAAGIAREAGIPVVADFERREVPWFEEILPLIDHLIVAGDFARELTGSGDPESAARTLHGETAGVVVVTCGADGCVYDTGEETGRLPAFAVDVVDTTGCGDVFHGAYAAALAESLPLLARFRLASAAAALKATKRGGQAGIPRRIEVERFLDARLKECPPGNSSP